MSTTAPANGGFTVETEGWVRVQLTYDETTSGSDIWVLPGRTYPVQVIAYEFPSPNLAPAGLTWLPEDLGGYRASRAFDEGETVDVGGSIGFYAGASGTLTVHVGGASNEVSLSIGDFWAGHADSVTFGTIMFITAIY